MATDDSFLPIDPFPEDLIETDPDEDLELVEDRNEADSFGEPVDDEEDATFVLEDDDEVPLGRSWYFDFQRRRFIIGANRQPIETHETVTLRQWIEKCLRTARGAHPIHPDWYGMEDPTHEIGLGLADFSPAFLRRRIEDALTQHPRITGIKHFSADFDGTDEGAVVTFAVEVDGPESPEDDAATTLLAFENIRL